MAADRTVLQTAGPRAHMPNRDPDDSHTTPAGLQANATLALRRLLFFTLNAVSWFLLLAWAASVLSSGGFSLLDGVLLLCIAIGLPWPAMGFWNAVIGLWVIHGSRDGLAGVAPFLASGDGREPLRLRTAVLMTLRNEDPGRAMLRFKTVKASLDATGHGGAFSYFVLSDSNRDDIAALEEEQVLAWQAELGDGARRLVYRRRAVNDGYKAGNIRDFCERHGADFDLMLPLDADSLMTGPAIVRLVRIMQAHPRLGIVQSLVVGTPSRSAFARIFQFGMRHGMRSYTLGQSWWTADCGPFWGHNAIIRIAPFVTHCKLPELPGAPPLGGPVLSHDQVEATLMRRAGFEVRVMPVEDGSYEDNPPDALEFMRRDMRWCQGNMQYVKLLGLKGLKPVSRFQLIWAVLMFVGVPAWTLAMIILPWVALEAQSAGDFPVASAAALYLTYLALSLSPKLAGVASALATPGEIKRFGGGWRYAVSVIVETLFGFLQGAAGAIRTTIFMVGLIFGRSIVWSGQQRDAVGVSWQQASAALWPSLAFGLALYGTLLVIAPGLIVWLLPLTAGYILAIPMTVALAHPGLGAFFTRHGLAAIPEDFEPPAEIVAVQPWLRPTA